jgi:hypothetical protein
MERVKVLVTIPNILRNNSFPLQIIPKLQNAGHREHNIKDNTKRNKNGLPSHSLERKLDASQTFSKTQTYGCPLEQRITFNIFYNTITLKAPTSENSHVVMCIN